MHKVVLHLPKPWRTPATALSKTAAALQLQREVAGAAASAIAVVQVQHEQHMLALREEQQQQLHNARQQVEQLQQQLHQLQQQQQVRKWLLAGLAGWPSSWWLLLLMHNAGVFCEPLLTPC